jgi:DHA2 family methylenomycin A resistance protein-like MFS transporter
VWAAGAAAALSAGPLVGGALIAAIGWRAIFFINLPIGALGIWLTLRHARETPASLEHSLDLTGQASAVVALAALAAATIEGGRLGWTAPAVLAGYALSAAAFAAFLRTEARRRQPMLPLTLFANRTFSAAAAIGFVLNVAVYGLIFVLSLFFQREQGRSALATGFAFAPMTAVVMATNVAAGKLAARTGPRRVVIAAALLAAAACAALLPTSRGTPYVAMVAQLFAFGAAIGLIVPLITSELLGSVDRARSGVASGTLNTMRQTGSVIGVALFGSLVGASGLTGGLHAALAVSVGLMALCGGLAAAIA